jgi:hypothetical protein
MDYTSACGRKYSKFSLKGHDYIRNAKANNYDMLSYETKFFTGHISVFYLCVINEKFFAVWIIINGMWLKLTCFNSTCYQHCNELACQ